MESPVRRVVGICTLLSAQSGFAALSGFVRRVVGIYTRDPLWGDLCAALQGFLRLCARQNDYFKVGPFFADFPNILKWEKQPREQNERLKVGPFFCKSS